MPRNREKKNQKSAPYRIWGENLDIEAIRQMDNACSLPISVKGALMPDAHKGYGLPIGGVLAVKNAVIPYAVGVDIACRVKMSVLDLPFQEYEKNRGKFKIALETETRFGVGQGFARPRQHRVMNDNWSFCPQVRNLKDKAWKQLGTSGSGNHFAEFGQLMLEKNDFGLEKGIYLALLTHSGSRGTGAAIAKHYSALAKKLHPELPRHLNNLAWLDLKSSEGEEYWQAMELMGRYASANHDIIHTGVLHHLGAISILSLENHHNFAWKEQLGHREVIVHRKGATPAGKDVPGIIPGSMASPTFIVRGLGNEAAMCSAAHGAGRKMSRTAAMKKFKQSDMIKLLNQRGITLISAGIDEIPMAYKSIETVMDQQKDLVEILGRFDPKLVKMAPPDRYAKKRTGKK
ncbi:tRNA-splicing ligase RtcB [Desulfocicer vacuolatum DSM 3385]|uniref:3'-phosphate/5'-hydroxy nucleic acid ligase n=1 Tax=Desulfocicer vacuolatum DSM 3385 TaxID=1121400 RepID=A0A1W2DKZ9_9BACT|nr:RtcB family protein [Desulfocicer vacuolatum]SMC98127.1 tRNA-splicing ligase RtcB [Desulfocicer vacuolatum DSM 3385]